MRNVRIFLLCAALAAASLASLPAPARAQQGRKPPPVRTIYLVRHGAYDEGDTLDEHVGRHLTEAGREQAKLTGRRFAALPSKVQAIYGSTMTRARETAEIAGAEMGMKPTLDADLCECGPPATDSAYAYHETPAQHEECRQQLDRAFARYFRPSPGADTTVVLFCHGNAMRYLVCKALGLDPAGTWWRFSVINGNLAEVQVRANGAMRVVSFGDVGHLPPALQTWNWRQKVYKD